MLTGPRTTPAGNSPDSAPEVARAHMPSDVTTEVRFFDRFAGRAATFASKPWFFAMCVLLVLVWAPSLLLIGNVDTWQLIINTATTIVTFLMVALLQNTQTRADRAVQDKLNAIADALADFMTAHADGKPGMSKDVAELKQAVGLEDYESA